jgi:arginine/lysine/ornithine decarboxylase
MKVLMINGSSNENGCTFAALSAIAQTLQTEEIETEKAIGRIAARLNLPCPPCIALAVPGEVIDEKIAGLLIKYGINKINVVK